MGWWSAPENPEIMVGDAVLDAVRHFFARLQLGISGRSFQQADITRTRICAELGVQGERR